MTKRLYILPLLLLLAGMLQAAPRLTVVVAVDGLQQDDLTRMRNYWPQGGLRTMSEEALQTNIRLPFLVYGGAETPATLFSGVNPCEHGVSGDKYYLRSTRSTKSTFNAPDQKGIGTSLSVSPDALRCLTWTDHFRLMAGERAEIYAIGLDANTTMCMAGHSANACCWFDAEQLKWVTTTYYDGGLPSAADKQNAGGRIQELNLREWTPRMDVAQYMNATAEEKKKSWSYTGFAGGHAPVMNDLVVELALALQKDKHLGEDIVPDLLMLQMTVLSPKAKCDFIESGEQEDMYLSVNQDLGYLQEQLNKHLGKDKYQLLVVGLPRKGMSDQQLEKAGMPKHIFNVDRAAALIGTYLMALYGHERWIDGGYGQAIFLNKTLIEQKKLSLENMRRQVSEFLLEFEGVQGACPASELGIMSGSKEVEKLQHSLTKTSRGDVVFWLEENWVSIEREGKEMDFVTQREPMVPVMLWSGTYRNFPEKSSINALNLYELLFD